MSYKGKIPFRRDGVTPIPGGNITYAPVVRDNFVFSASMKIEGGSQGRRMVLRDVATGIKYVIFITDLLKVLNNTGCDPGAIIRYREWTFCKRNTIYGITPA